MVGGAGEARRPTRGLLGAWCDENNVCSLVRLQVLEHELKQMGLECTANGRNGCISLRVDVPLATKSKNCVHIDGVDVVVSGRGMVLRICRHCFLF